MGTPRSSRQSSCCEFVHLNWPADPVCLTAIRGEVRRFLAPLALTEEARQDLVLAVSEAATNAVAHAYTPATTRDTVELTSWTEDHNVCFEIVDHGQWRTPSDRPIGRGLGIPVMQRAVEAVLIHYDRRGTRVLLSHPLPGDARCLPSNCDSPTSLEVPSSGAQGRPPQPATPLQSNRSSVGVAGSSTDGSRRGPRAAGGRPGGIRKAPNQSARVGTVPGCSAQ
jgi:anti-sigma regulatory factor (Ser/Thr protein kinase)